MYTVKELMSMTRPLINQHWATYAVGANQFIHLVNTALNMIYNYEGMHWSWEHRKDLFNMNWQNQWALLSRRPVRKIDKFWTSNWTDVDKIWLDKCYCNMNLPDKIITPCCECNCVEECHPLDLKEILPQNKLCAMEYQISWSFIAGMWWLDGRIVKVDVGTLQVYDLWMTYFCGPVKMEKFSDIVPLPDSFMHVAMWIIAALVIPMYWIARQQEDLSLYSLYRKELDFLRKQDTIFMEKLILPDNHMPDVNGFIPKNEWNDITGFNSVVPITPW